MDNFSFLNVPTTGSSTNSERVLPQPEAELNQSASFAGMATSVHLSGQALIPSPPAPPPAYQQAPQPRQLSALDVSPQAATQYLPQLDLPQLNLTQLDLPPIDPFEAIAAYQPICFDDYITPLPSDDLDPMRDIDELLMEELKEAYVPAEPSGDISGLTRTVTISIPQDTIDSSVDEHFKKSFSATGTSTGQDTIETSIEDHFKRSLSGTGKTFQKRPYSSIDNTTIFSGTTTSRSTITSTTPAPKKRVTSATSTISLTESEPVVAPPVLPIGVHGNTDHASTHSEPQQPPDPFDERVLVEESEEKPFKCGYLDCNKRYKKKQHMTSHFMKHISTTNFKCPYPECVDEYYFDRSALKRHIRVHHAFEKPYECKICHRHFRSADHLKYHMTHLHPASDKKKSPKRKRK